MPGGVNLELPPPAQAPNTMQQPGPGPRNYKSRKYRPCDFCRARQVACKIEIAPPCQLCQSHRRECTFVEQPKKKRRPPAESAGAGAPVAAAAATSSQGSGSRAATGTPAEGSRVHIGRSHITSQRHFNATVSEGAPQLTMHQNLHSYQFSRRTATSPDTYIPITFHNLMSAYSSGRLAMTLFSITSSSSSSSSRSTINTTKA